MRTWGREEGGTKILERNLKIFKQGTLYELSDTCTAEFADNGELTMFPRGTILMHIESLKKGSEALPFAWNRWYEHYFLDLNGKVVFVIGSKGEDGDLPIKEAKRMVLT